MRKKLEVMQYLFPTATDYGRGGGEANGLAKDTRPNGEIIAEGYAFYERAKETKFYLVSIGDTIAAVRNKAAMEGSGYEEFSVLHGHALLEDVEDVADILRFFNNQTDLNVVLK